MRRGIEAGRARWCATPLMAAALLGAAMRAAPADDGATRFLATNEAGIARLYATHEIDIDDPASVFATVFAALDDEVRVLPTENYYFFGFVHQGVEYAGNFRLDAADRDDGVIHFAYFPRGPGGEPGTTRQAWLGAGDGVKVTRVDDFTYVVHHRRKAVLFRLNDLSDVRPGPGQLRDGETFIGPVFDESGIGFFLVWNPELEVFHYILDEDRAPDRFEPAAVSEQLAIGRRTGFAVYRDRYAPRRILVGVRRDQALNNTNLDGPFDQMPDNFITDGRLRVALTARVPDLAGRIDRRGNLAGLAGRVIIVPYVLYQDTGELARFDQCAARAVAPEEYYRCFDRGAVVATPDTEGRTP